MTKGIYVLLIELWEDKEIIVGKKGRIAFPKGFYGYVGSALCGLERRLARHLSPVKKRHWHIDYLLDTAKIKGILCAEAAEKKECALAQSLSHKLPLVAGFGCSDCNCPSHLFFCPKKQDLEISVIDAINGLGLYPFTLQTAKSVSFSWLPKNHNGPGLSIAF